MQVLLHMQTVESLAEDISMGKVLEAGLESTCFHCFDFASESPFQEFHGDGKAEAEAKSIYKVLIQRRRCKTIEWRKVPCQHTLGAREGSPGMFFRYGRVFVFGGWGSQGPTSDLDPDWGSSQTTKAKTGARYRTPREQQAFHARKQRYRAYGAQRHMIVGFLQISSCL